MPAPSALQTLREDDLVRDILIPLFEAMGCRDVRFHGGGGEEQGKDVVMWREEDGRRVNVAVVAKAVRVSGKAKGAGSAGEVTMQVLQAFGHPFLDAHTSEPREVDEVWVVTSRALTPGARKAVRSALRGARRDHDVRYVDGDALARLVDEHLGPHAALTRSRAALADLQAIVPGIPLTLTSSPTGTWLVADDRALPTPLHAPRARLDVPDTAEGRAARDALDHHRRTGLPIAIPASCLAEIRVDARLAPLYEAVGGRLGGVILENPRVGRVVRLDLSVSAPDAQVSLANLPFRVAQAGSERVVLEPEGQGPWRIGLSVEGPAEGDSAAVSLVFGFEPTGASVRQAFQESRLRTLLLTGATLFIVTADAQIPLIGPVSVRLGGPEADEGWALAVEALAEVQARTRADLRLPSGRLTPDDLDAALRARHVVTTGVETVSVDSVDLGLSGDALAAARRELPRRGDALTLLPTRHDTLTVLGQPVPVGPSVWVLAPVTLTPDGRAVSRDGGDIEARVYYPDWMPASGERDGVAAALARVVPSP